MKARRFSGAIVALMAGLAACGSDDKMDDKKMNDGYMHDDDKIDDGHDHKMHDGK